MKTLLLIFAIGLAGHVTANGLLPLEKRLPLDPDKILRLPLRKAVQQLNQSIDFLDMTKAEISSLLVDIARLDAVVVGSGLTEEIMEPGNPDGTLDFARRIALLLTGAAKVEQETAEMAARMEAYLGKYADQLLLLTAAVDAVTELSTEEHSVLERKLQEAVRRIRDDVD